MATSCASCACCATIFSCLQGVCPSLISGCSNPSNTGFEIRNCGNLNRCFNGIFCCAWGNTTSDTTTITNTDEGGGPSVISSRPTVTASASTTVQDVAAAANAIAAANKVLGRASIGSDNSPSLGSSHSVVAVEPGGTLV